MSGLISEKLTREDHLAMVHLHTKPYLAIGVVHHRVVAIVDNDTVTSLEVEQMVLQFRRSMPDAAAAPLNWPMRLFRRLKRDGRLRSDREIG